MYLLIRAGAGDAGSRAVQGPVADDTGIFHLSTVLVLTSLFLADVLNAGIDREELEIETNQKVFHPPASSGAVCLYGPLLYPHSLLSLPAPPGRRRRPSTFLGTDNLGIDIFAQLSKGFYLSMMTG